MIGKLIVWILVAYGMTSIIVWGSIFERPRSWIKEELGIKFFAELISCTLCTATWVGFFISLVTGGLCSDVFEINIFFGTFFDGLLTAGAVWAFNNIIEFFEENRIC